MLCVELSGSAVVASSVQASPCPGVVLLTKLEQDQFNLLLSNSGINWDLVYETFSYGLYAFAVGIGCGLLLNVVRKIK